ncbi:T9SS type A sorting domain-containing protein [bacterium]|nr:T9SS type A sorting domain-containing protein [bacterium]
MRFLFALTILFALAFSVIAIPFTSAPPEIRHFAENPEEAERLAPLEPTYEGGFDVLHYDLAISFQYPTDLLSGRSGIIVEATSSAESIYNFHIGSNLSADSVSVNSEPVAFSVHSDSIAVSLISPSTISDTLRIDIYYHNLTGAGYQSDANRYGEIIGYSHSQPNDARLWWPCHDVPYDKATLRFSITVPGTLDVLSNGVCADTLFFGDSTTYIWQTDYHIPTYLVVVDIGEFDIVDFPYYFPMGTYCYPGDLSIVNTKFGYVTDAMAVFEELFAPYPFEKYYMSVVPLGYMAMENQTATSMGESYLYDDEYFVVAHELSHHWWGDALTCGTWKDIWLNEGFASYCEALYIEQAYTWDDFREYVWNDQMAYITSWEFNSFPIYDPYYMWGRTVYQKGASILDMLRFQTGDSLFFDIIRDYFSRYIYSSAVTTDFIEVCEDNYGDSLSWFFDQWVYSAHTPTLQWRYFTDLINPFPDDSISRMVLVHQDEPAYRIKFGLSVVNDAGSIIERLSATVTENDQPIHIKHASNNNIIFDNDHRALYAYGFDITDPIAEVTGRDVKLDWEPFEDWIDITHTILMKVNATTLEFDTIAWPLDTFATDSDVDPGVYQYFIAGIWEHDSAFATFQTPEELVTVPEAGDEFSIPVNTIAMLDDSAVYKIYYFPLIQECDGFRISIKAIVATDSFQIYSCRDSLPEILSGVVSEYDFVDYGDNIEPARISYTTSSSPSAELYHIYYFVVKTGRPSAIFNFTTEYLTMDIDENATVRPEEIDVTIYPNPFNSAITLSILETSNLKAYNQIETQIFDISGRLIADLDMLSNKTDNSISIIWEPDATVESGVYFARIKIDNIVVNKRIVFLK